MPEEEVKRYKITAATLDEYMTYLTENHRPPSRGGNTAALHVHTIVISGDQYTFFALGSRKWVYQGDTVSFEYTIKQGKYRNIEKSTLETRDKDGQVVIRGDRGFKPTLRTASARLPGSRREQRG